jgi:hypothetical protein
MTKRQATEELEQYIEECTFECPGGKWTWRGPKWTERYSLQLGIEDVVGRTTSTDYAAQVNWNRDFQRLMKRNGEIHIPLAPDYSTQAKISALARQGGTHTPTLKPIAEDSHRWQDLLRLAYPNKAIRKRVQAA